MSATLHSCFSRVRWTLEEESVSARLFHVLSKISVPKKMYCSNDEITYHFEAQEPEDYARLGI